jgi:hypothetical protein
MGARHRVGIGFSYRTARLYRVGGIHSLELIPGLHKRLIIRAQVSRVTPKNFGKIVARNCKTYVSHSSYRYFVKNMIFKNCHRKLITTKRRATVESPDTADSCQRRQKAFFPYANRSFLDVIGIGSTPPPPPTLPPSPSANKLCLLTSRGFICGTNPNEREKRVVL